MPPRWTVQWWTVQLREYAVQESLRANYDHCFFVILFLFIAPFLRASRHAAASSKQSHCRRGGDSRRLGCDGTLSTRCLVGGVEMHLRRPSAARDPRERRVVPAECAQHPHPRRSGHLAAARHVPRRTTIPHPLHPEVPRAPGTARIAVGAQRRVLPAVRATHRRPRTPAFRAALPRPARNRLPPRATPATSSLFPFFTFSFFFSFFIPDTATAVLHRTSTTAHQTCLDSTPGQQPHHACCIHVHVHIHFQFQFHVPRIIFPLAPNENKDSKGKGKGRKGWKDDHVCI